MLACKICHNVSGNITHQAREMMFGLRDTFTYLECWSCGCVQLLTPPSDLSRYYPSEYYSLAPGGLVRAFLRRSRAAYTIGRFSALGWLARHLMGPDEPLVAVRRANISLSARILDVGCGAGELIRHMRLLGYTHVSGIDPFIERDMVSVDGVKILKRTIADIEGPFDVVMLHHSFEHMPEPANEMRQLARILAPDGRVLLRIPYAASFAWKHYGVNWFQLDAPRHFFLHTEKSIVLLAAQNGLQAEPPVFEGNASQFLGSEQYVRDVPLADRKSAYGGGLRRWSTLWRTSRLRGRVEELNRRGEGDQVCITLRRAERQEEVPRRR